MKILLDTNILIWWFLGDSKLKDKFRQIIADPQNIKFVSVVSVWEIIIKIRSGKLRLSMPMKNIFDEFGFEILNINLNHVLEVGTLPLYHKDPFDRMLVAQARAEDCVLLTTDKKIKRYKVSTI